ncbi:hypothetical protein ACWDXT_35435, partial [Streptomyces sp. NPDC003236]
PAMTARFLDMRRCFNFYLLWGRTQASGVPGYGGVTRARALAARHPASYACWDIVQHPDPAIGDTRALPYTKRRTLLLEVLAEVGPPLQPVPATDDRDVAEHWYETLWVPKTPSIACDLRVLRYG